MSASNCFIIASQTQLRDSFASKPSKYWLIAWLFIIWYCRVVQYLFNFEFSFASERERPFCWLVSLFGINILSRGFLSPLILAFHLLPFGNCSEMRKSNLDTEGLERWMENARWWTDWDIDRLMNVKTIIEINIKCFLISLSNSFRFSHKAGIGDCVFTVNNRRGGKVRMEQIRKVGRERNWET